MMNRNSRSSITCRQHGSLQHRILLASLAFLPVAFLTACDSGPRLIRLKGTVNVDGEPAGGVGILFFGSDSEIVASAKSEADGSFSPMTDMKPGIPQGNYTVAATWPDPSYEPPKMSMGTSPPDAPDLLNGRYVKNRTDVTLEVTSSTSETVIELKTKN